MKAFLLCGGYGTRLGSLTKNVPKVMLPINGEPILAHNLKLLQQNGYTDIAINVHFKPEMIKNYVGDGNKFGVSVKFIHEESLSGTAGILKRSTDFIGSSEDFLVYYGDIITNQSLKDIYQFHKNKMPIATLLVHRRKKSNSEIICDDNMRITSFMERPSISKNIPSDRGENVYVNSGIQILNKRILKYIGSDGSTDLPRDIYAKIYEREQLYAFPIKGQRIAIDSKDRYIQAQNLDFMEN